MWKKSTYSGGDNGSQCIELCNDGDTVGIRDSKKPDAGALRLPANALDAVTVWMRTA